jgi:hypothetical protein
MSANTSITMYEKQSKKFYGQLYVQTQLKDQRRRPEGEVNVSQSKFLIET